MKQQTRTAKRIPSKNPPSNAATGTTKTIILFQKLWIIIQQIEKGQFRRNGARSWPRVRQPACCWTPPICYSHNLIIYYLYYCAYSFAYSSPPLWWGKEALWGWANLHSLHEKVLNLHIENLHFDIYILWLREPGNSSHFVWFEWNTKIDHLFFLFFFSPLQLDSFAYNLHYLHLICIMSRHSFDSPPIEKSPCKNVGGVKWENHSFPSPT